jgi:cobalt-zinc-cadmium efflux system outer membrane protein
MTRSRTAIAACAVIAGLGSSAYASESAPSSAPAESLQRTLESPIGEAAAIDSTFTLDDYLALAVKRSAALRGAYYGWTAAVEKSRYAGSLPEPMFSYGRFIENVETRVGPQEQRFSLRQSYPWFGTLGAKEDMASEAAEAAYQRFESERLRLFYQVKSAYYEYYYLGRDIGLTRDNMDLLKFWESVVRTKFKVALKKHPDVIRAQVELGKLEDRLLSLMDKKAPAAARLRAALNLPSSAALPIPAHLQLQEMEIAGGAVQRALLEHNPDLSSLRHAVAMEEAGVRLAKKTYFPTLTFGVDYIQTGEAVNPATPESGKDAWMVGVGVKLPIWLGANRAQAREAQARRTEAEFRLVDAENNLVALGENVKFEYDDALRKIRLYRDGLVPKAEQSLNASYAAYQAGELDFLNVLDAQRELLNLQLKLERASSDLGTKGAELEMLTGRGIEDLAAKKSQ